MKKLLIFLGVIILFAGFIYGAGEVVYTQGNTEAIRGNFLRFYMDSLQQKGDSTSRTISVLRGIGYNLKIWVSDPNTREESLYTAIWINSQKPVENTKAVVQASEGVIDFGYDNKADTLYFYGIFSSFEFLTWTGTAGADAADSIMHIHYSFSGMR